jgi:hypothetical protein
MQIFSNLFILFVIASTLKEIFKLIWRFCYINQFNLANLAYLAYLAYKGPNNEDFETYNWPIKFKIYNFKRFWKHTSIFIIMKLIDFG